MKKLHDIEYPDRKYTIADNVRCCYCGLTGLVTKGREDCPNCKNNGFFAWIDANKPEVDI